MAIAPFLAMTAAEICACPVLPPKIAWMACHFSPYGLGLSNLPRTLPPGSLLMVDDITPPHEHDPALIGKQLHSCVEALQCSAVLPDFQRIGSSKAQNIAQHLTTALPCPVVVSEAYACQLDCPVLLPFLPPSVALKSYLEPWEGRDVWVEIGLTGEQILLTEKGSRTTPLPYPDIEKDGLSDPGLHCHYCIETNKTSAGFTLWRRSEDLDTLLEEAEALGVAGALGLFQELEKFQK